MIMNNSNSENAYPTAASIMDPNPTVIHPDDKVSQAVRFIMQNRYRRLPVVDSQGHFEGVFGVQQVVHLVFPKAVSMEKGLKTIPFVRDTLSDLHRRLKEVEDEPVSICMHCCDVVTVNPDTALLETLLILYNTRASLPVVDPDTDKLVGAISYFDALEKILAAEV